MLVPEILRILRNLNIPPFFLLLSLMFSFNSCKNDTKKEKPLFNRPMVNNPPVVNQPICPKPDPIPAPPVCDQCDICEPTPIPPSLPISSIIFAGINEVTHVTQRRGIIRWNFPEENAEKVAQYLVFKINDLGEKEFLVALKNDRNNYTLSNLTPGKTYRTQVHLLDQSGKMDANTIEGTFTTLTYPTFENNKSLNFTGTNFLTGKASNLMLRQNESFSLGLWFKTSVNHSQEGRLLNLHRSALGETAVNIGIHGDKLFVGYRHANNTYARLEHTLITSDNQWRHVGVSYHEGTLELYLSGVLVGSIATTLHTFGTAPMTVGSYLDGSNPYRGQLDEVALWKKALTPEEMFAVGGNPSQDLRLHSNYADLTGWWRMGDVRGDGAVRLRSVQGGGDLMATNVVLADYILDAP